MRCGKGSRLQIDRSLGIVVGGEEKCARRGQWHQGHRHRHAHGARWRAGHLLPDDRRDHGASFTSGNAITIDANFVTLDLNGHKVHGANAGTATQAIGTLGDNRRRFSQSAARPALFRTWPRCGPQAWRPGSVARSSARRGPPCRDTHWFRTISNSFAELAAKHKRASTSSTGETFR